jgi:hypothetical protein
MELTIHGNDMIRFSSSTVRPAADNDQEAAAAI